MITNPSKNLPTFDYVTVQVRQLDERFHALIAREQAGVATQAETAELDHLCALKEADDGRSVPPIHADEWQMLGNQVFDAIEGKRV